MVDLSKPSLVRRLINGRKMNRVTNTESKDSEDFVFFYEDTPNHHYRVPMGEMAVLNRIPVVDRDTDRVVGWYNVDLKSYVIIKK